MTATMWLPVDLSAHGYKIDQLITLVHYFMAALFVGWGIFFAYCLIRFRARAGHAADYADIKAKPSKYAEIIVVGVEAFLLIGLAMPVWAYYRSEPPTADKNPLVVRVVAQQFAWNIHYPGPDGKFGPTKPELVDETVNPVGLDKSDPAAADDVVNVNNFFIPKDRDILVRLSSKDVIHSFAVPLLRVKQDAIPGMEIPLWFKATQTNDEARPALAETYSLPATEEEAAVFVEVHGNLVAMADYGSANGAPILAKGAFLSVPAVRALMTANITEIALAPSEPVNIQCAQLCGLGHYRMMGQMKILEPAAFEEWYAGAGKEEEFLEEDFDE